MASGFPVPTTLEFSLSKHIGRVATTGDEGIQKAPDLILQTWGLDLSIYSVGRCW